MMDMTLVLTAFICFVLMVVYAIEGEVLATIGFSLTFITLVITLWRDSK